MSQYSENRKGTGLAPHAAGFPGTSDSSTGSFMPFDADRIPVVQSRAGNGIGTLGVIWAEDCHHVIGAGGGMVWRVPDDLRFFKETTMGCPVIMGTGSFKALGEPLKGRRNIILTRHPSALADFTREGLIETASNLDDAIKLCAGTKEVWITGGGVVYQEVMDAGIADLLVVSQLDLEAPVPPGAKVAVAPVIDPQRWQLDESRSDATWRPVSGDSAWRVQYYVPR